MNMAAVWQSAKPFLLWAMVAVIMAATVLLAFGVLIAWGFSTWYIERDLSDETAAWLFFLNVANFFMIPIVAIAARNPMKILNFAGGFWAAGLAFALLGVGHLTIIMAVVGVLLYDPVADGTGIGDTMMRWLPLLNLTNVLLAFTAGIAAIITPLWGGNRWAVYALGLLYATVAAHTVMLVLFFGAIADGQWGIIFIWLGLSGGLTVLGVLSWRQGRAVFTLAGAAMAAVAFVGAWFYAPLFYGGGLPYASWHPVWVCAVPVLLFLAVLRRGRIRGFGRAR